MTTIQSILSRLTKAVCGIEKMLYPEPKLNNFARATLTSGTRTPMRMSSPNLSLTFSGTQTKSVEDAQSVAD